MGNKKENEMRENDTQKFERIVGECLATLKREKREYKSAATLESELKRTSATQDNVLHRLSKLVDHQEDVIRHHLGDKDAETAKRCVAALGEIYLDLEMTISHELESA